VSQPVEMVVATTNPRGMREAAVMREARNTTPTGGRARRCRPRRGRGRLPSPAVVASPGAGVPAGEAVAGT
jgi:hypothetical protein